MLTLRDFVAISRDREAVRGRPGKVMYAKSHQKSHQKWQMQTGPNHNNYLCGQKKCAFYSEIGTLSPTLSLLILSGNLPQPRLISHHKHAFIATPFHTIPHGFYPFNTISDQCRYTVSPMMPSTLFKPDLVHRF